MSNLELASICIAIFSICCALSGVILVILNRQERKVNDQTLRRIVNKLQELEDSPSCGPRFDGEKQISIRWLLNYIEEVKDAERSL